MIGDTLTYIARRVDAFLPADKSISQPSADNHRIAFPSINQSGTLSLQQDRISMLLVNVEEQREQRALDIYRIRHEPGSPDKIFRKNPGTRLNLYTLFIASFADYATSWNQLGELIYGFQLHPFFSCEEDPEFPIDAGMITNEMISQNPREQQEIWRSLRICQHPALLYRFKLLTLEPREDQPQPRVTSVGVTYQRE